MDIYQLASKGLFPPQNEIPDKILYHFTELVIPFTYYIFFSMKQ